MDPQACFDEWVALSVDPGSWSGGRDERIDDLVDAYDGWARGGGFLAVDRYGDRVMQFSTVATYQVELTDDPERTVTAWINAGEALPA